MMKALAVVLALASGQPVAGDSIDLATYSCKEHIPQVLRARGNRDEQMGLHILHFWLYGFVSGQSENRKLSLESGTTFVTGLIEECAKSPEQTVMKAAEAVYAKQGGA